MKVMKILILPTLTLCVGIALGIIIRDFPLFTISYNLKITEIISVLLTFGIGVFVPLLVKKLIDDKRSFKNSLIEEVNTFNKTTSRINDRIEMIYTSSKITQADKDGLTVLFEIADEEFNSLYSFIGNHCKPGTQKELENFKEKFIEYWKILTGSEVTKSDVSKIDDSTYRKANKTYQELKNIVRNMKAQLNSL